MKNNKIKTVARADCRKRVSLSWVLDNHSSMKPGSSCWLPAPPFALTMQKGGCMNACVRAYMRMFEGWLGFPHRSFWEAGYAHSSLPEGPRTEIPPFLRPGIPWPSQWGSRIPFPHVVRSTRRCEAFISAVRAEDLSVLDLQKTERRRKRREPTRHTQTSANLSPLQPVMNQAYISKKK